MIRLDDIKKRLVEATPGPWQVWDGPAYAGGGKDLCIGAGETWLANMDEREGVNTQERADHSVACCTAGVCGDPDCEAKDPEKAPGKLNGHDPKNCDICSISDEVTREQRGNAELIAHAPDDLAWAVREVEFLVGVLKFVMEGPRAWVRAERVLKEGLSAHAKRCG